MSQYKLTRKQELDLFVTSEIKETKFMLLERRHQRMDEIIKDNADYGGRYIEKQEEPIEAPIEAPVIQEMRMMHMDFVEDAYWKRCQAMKLALACQEVALKQAKRRIRATKEKEAIARQQDERAAEQERATAEAERAAEQREQLEKEKLEKGLAEEANPAGGAFGQENLEQPEANNIGQDQLRRQDSVSPFDDIMPGLDDDLGGGGDQPAFDDGFGFDDDLGADLQDGGEPVDLEDA